MGAQTVFRTMSERTASATQSPLLRRFLCDASGATAVEYGMIGGLIFAVIAGTLKLYGSKLDSVYLQIGSTIAQAN